MRLTFDKLLQRHLSHEHTVDDVINLSGLYLPKTGGTVTGNVVLQSGLRISSGAASGYVLTSDSAGNATWASTSSPSAHASTHQSGGSDSIKIDDLAAPDDNTDLDVSITKHGLTPKAPNDTTKFLRGDGTWAVPPDSTYTDEQAQDAVGGALVDTATIDFTYDDAGNQITASVKAASITEAMQTLADNTTGDVSSTKHGYAPKSPADATKFLNGGAAPAFALVKDSDLSTSDITTNDVSTSKHGFIPKAPNDAAKVLNGTGAWSPFEHWDVVKILSADFDITNAVFQDVTGCAISITNGQTYEIEVVGASSGNDATGDVAISLEGTGGASWGTGQAWREGVHFTNAGSLTTQSPVAPSSSTVFMTSPGVTINNGDSTARPFRVRWLFTATGTGTATLKMGNASAAVGRTSTLKAGTIFKARRIG